MILSVHLCGLSWQLGFCFCGQFFAKMTRICMIVVRMWIVGGSGGRSHFQLGSKSFKHWQANSTKEFLLIDIGGQTRN